MSLPLSGTEIRFLQNIKWRPDYKHTRYFSTTSEQTSWFVNKTPKFTMSQANYQKIEGKYSVQVPYHVDSLWDINYMMFKNENYNKWFYCFVEKIEYLNKNTSRVYFDVDVYQTWFLETKMNPSYIERQHVTEYEDQLPTINTIDEGLDYGTMYDTIEVSQVTPSGEVMYMVVVTKQVLLESDDVDNGEILPVINGSPQPLTFYIIPFMRDGGVPNSSPNGTSSVEQVLNYMYTSESAVNNIVSIYTTDYIGIANADETSVTFDPEFFKHVTLLKADSSVSMYRLTKMYSYQTKTITVTPKYGTIDFDEPSKLWMSPYYKVFLDDFQGHRVEIKPEYILSPNINVKAKGSIGTSNKVSYEVLAYNYGTTEPYVDQVGMEYGLVNNNPNDVPIITDLLAAYLQGNRNSLENQVNQTIFNGVSGVISGAGSTITSGLARNASGVASGLGSVVSSTADTLFALEGLQAKTKDIDNTPPSISNQGGNNYFTLGNGYRGCYVIKKRIKPEYLKIIGDYLKRYGYKYNRNEVPNLHSRVNWNFIKMVDCLLDGSIPQEEMFKLQQVFNNGLTVWHTDDIGNYNLKNGVR